MSYGQRPGAQVAQLVEHATENRSVGGSIPPLGILLVVHNEQETRDLAVTASRAAFLEVIGFDDPMRRWMRWKPPPASVSWVTRVEFGSGKPHGVASARMVRRKRPGTRVVVIARAEYEPHGEGLGVFLPMPLNPDILVATVSRLLTSRD
jgi:hypothetical protein